MNTQSNATVGAPLETFAAARDAARSALTGLRWLEQVHSGDGLVAGRSADPQAQRVLQALDAYAVEDSRILTRALEQLDDTRRRDLVMAYRHALETAPTRPHPHLPSRGPAGVLAFRLEAWWDRAMNTMDSRHSPTPRRRRTVATPGKWTGYLMGGMPPTEPSRVQRGS